MFHLVILSWPNVQIALVFQHKGHREKRQYSNHSQWPLQLDQNHQYWHGSCKHLLSRNKIPKKKVQIPHLTIVYNNLFYHSIHWNWTSSWTGWKCTITVGLAINIIIAAGLTFKQRRLTIHNAIWKVHKTPLLKMALQSCSSFKKLSYLYLRRSIEDNLPTHTKKPNIYIIWSWHLHMNFTLY